MFLVYILILANFMAGKFEEGEIYFNDHLNKLEERDIIQKEINFYREQVLIKCKSRDHLLRKLSKSKFETFYKNDIDFFRSRSINNIKFSIGKMKTFHLGLRGNGKISVKRISKNHIFNKKNYLRLLKEFYAYEVLKDQCA